LIVLFVLCGSSWAAYSILFVGVRGYFMYTIYIIYIFLYLIILICTF